MMKCLAMDVSRGTTHDGPGMRTTVFMKGCPLHCLWCQNPESINPINEVWWQADKCIGCFSCQQACEPETILCGPGGITVTRDRCTACGNCVDACPSKAMDFVGVPWTLDALIREVMKDKHYYDSFDGGVTVSGGEPLSQADFVAEFFLRLLELGVHTALDTCGFAPKSALDQVLPHTSAVLFDLKIFDPEQHRQFTGCSNQRILENFAYAADYIRNQRLQGREMTLWVRTPLIPDATATRENIAAIASYLKKTAGDVLDRWELCAFNSACAAKYQKMGLLWAYAEHGPMGQDIIQDIMDTASTIFPDKLLVSGIIKRQA